MSTTTLQLDHFVDPFEARVVYQKDDSGAIVDARFDLTGLPRLDPMLVGKPVDTVPDVVKRLCGICPVTHHLAGVRALDALYGADVPETARLVRDLLNCGSILDAVAPKLFATHRDLAVSLKKAGKLAMSAAGCAGHFPDVAVLGGVRAPADTQLCAETRATLPALIDAIGTLPEDPDWEDTFTGISLALMSGENLAALGNTVVTSEGQRFTAAEFAAAVVETNPGQPAPRPELAGRRYRVGPVAQAHVLGQGLGPHSALKAMLLRVVHEIEQIVVHPATCAGDIRAEGRLRAGVGVGLAEGPRGLLVHRYVADEQGRVTECQILTPTAQNEWWLAQMLQESLIAERPLEQSIRTADPCLPITQAPEGAMGITVAEQD